MDLSKVTFFKLLDLGPISTDSSKVITHHLFFFFIDNLL